MNWTPISTWLLFAPIRNKFVGCESFFRWYSSHALVYFGLSISLRYPLYPSTLGYQQSAVTKTYFNNKPEIHLWNIGIHFSISHYLMQFILSVSDPIALESNIVFLLWQNSLELNLHIIFMRSVFWDSCIFRKSTKSTLSKWKRWRINCRYAVIWISVMPIMYNGTEKQKENYEILSFSEEFSVMRWLNWK